MPVKDLWTQSPCDYAQVVLIKGLTALAVQGDASHRPKSIRKVIELLPTVFWKNTRVRLDPDHLDVITKLASRMEPVEAGRVCKPLVERLWQARSSQPFNANTRLELDEQLGTLLGHLPPADARMYARRAAELMASERDCAKTPRDFDSSRSEVPTIVAILNDASRDGLWKREVSAALMIADQGRAKPLPCRLTTQELTNLLKMPTCLGSFRDAILAHLGQQYDRQFRNSWEFAGFITQHNPEVDLTSPPIRPRYRENISTSFSAEGFR